MRRSFFAHHNHLALTITLSVGLVFSSGCLEGSQDGASNSPSQSSSFIFGGLTSASNTNGSTIVLNWSPAIGSGLQGYIIYQVGSGQSLTKLGNATAAATSFQVTNLTANTWYNFLVKAIDASGNTDSNQVIKSAFTYPGVSNAIVGGTNNITVTYPSLTNQALGIQISAIAHGSVFQTVTALPTSSSYTFTALNSGTNYTFQVKAFFGTNYLDSNTTTVSARTTDIANAKAVGFIYARAVGPAPNAVDGETVARITIAWQNFTGTYYPVVTYHIYRVVAGGLLDPTSPLFCTPTTTLSCEVICDTATSRLTTTLNSCTDNSVGVSPVAYDYYVTYGLTNNSVSYLEDPPLIAGKVIKRVQVPPTNMVLVDRDTVNFELCRNLSKTSDPLNHYTCAYTGLGATSNATAGTVFDLGYSFFIDRFEAACNWTRSASGGMCGAGASAGDCFGSGSPAGTIGVDGNVYYDTQNAVCWAKNSGSWVDAKSATTAALRSKIITTDPGNYRPPLVNVSQQNAQDYCSSVSDSSYGNKRLPRQREFRAAAIWGLIQGAGASAYTAFGVDPSNAPDIHDYEVGSMVYPTNAPCNTNLHNGTTAANSFGQSGYTLAGGIGSQTLAYNIGSSSTSGCKSLFGAQDLVGNVDEWVSDQVSCNTGTSKCIGQQSSLDSNNKDISGLNFDGTQAVAPSVVQFPYYVQATPYYASLPLGLPLATTDNNNALTVLGTRTPSAPYTPESGVPQITQHNSFSMVLTDTAIYGLRAGGTWTDSDAAGRYRSQWSSNSAAQASTTVSAKTGFRCVLPIP